MYQLTEKLRELVPYEPISGEYKIRLDANESFFVTPAEVIARAAEKAALNRYPDPYAKCAVDAFAGFYGISPDTVTAGNGSDELISIITGCFLKKGEKVLCFSRDFSMYSFYSYLYELEVLVMEKEPDLTIDVDKAIACANENNVRCIIFSNPCNPTSLGLKKADVKRLIENVNALVVLDEAYMDFWDESESFLGDAEKYDNLIVLRTCSKALAMAGIRLGLAVADKAKTNALRAAKSPYNVNSVTQLIAAQALSDHELLRKNIAEIKRSVRELYTMLSGANCPYFEKIYEPVTNFVYIKCEKCREIYEYLLSRSIAVRCMNGYLRITCGTAEENRAVTAAIADFRA